MSGRIRAQISRQALQHNFQLARQLAGLRRLVAVIKADAYGHGLVPVAETLADAEVFGVTDINEAEALRQAGCDKAILVMQGLIEPGDAERIGAAGFDLVVHRREDLAKLEQSFTSTPPARPLRLWLKLQSGMGRLGLPQPDYAGLYRTLRAKSWVREVIAMTHLANSATPGAQLNQQQQSTFAETLDEIPGSCPRSISASGGLLALDCQEDWARPGIMLYGSSPFAWSDTARRSMALGLQPVMTLQARLISISEQPAGANIGYNSQFICPRPMRIGIVSCGYADGYPVMTPNYCPVSLGGKRSQTLGRVSMDMLAIDLSEIPEAKVDDWVTLWGDSVPVDEVAAHSGTISYSLFTSLSRRVPRFHA